MQLTVDMQLANAADPDAQRTPRLQGLDERAGRVPSLQIELKHVKFCRFSAITVYGEAKFGPDISIPHHRHRDVATRR